MDKQFFNEDEIRKCYKGFLTDGNIKGACEYFQRYASGIFPEVPDDFRLFIKKLKSCSDVESSVFWRGCSSSHQLFAEEIYQDIINHRGSFQCVISKFCKFFFTLNIPENKILELKNELSIVLFCFGYGDDTTSSDEFIARFNGNESDKKYIIVSGMGFSGSSAVYDYLRSSDEVSVCTEEIPFIQNDEALLGLYESLDDIRLFKVSFLKFLFKFCFGVFPFQNGWDMKYASYARENIRIENIDSFTATLSNCCKLFYLIVLSFSDFEIDRRYYFKRMASEVLDSFVSYSDPLKQIRLLDNAVNISKVRCVNFIDNSILLAVFRDPRANFAAYSAESPTFNSSYNAFIGKRRKLYDQIESEIQVVSKNTTVFRVQFENFVLNGQYREDLVKLIGVNPSSLSYKYFKPWESVKNVLIHLSHNTIDCNNAISDKLGDWCVECGVCSLNFNSAF